MATSIGELFLKLRVDGASEFKNQLAEATRGVTVLAGSISALSGIAVKMASNFTETTNVIDVAFGRNAKAVEAWAVDTGRAMGRSTQQMRDFAGTMQSMLAPMLGNSEKAATMSKALAQLSVDIGSFANVADADAFTKLTSAMSGETEAIKSLGVNMSVASQQQFAYTQGISRKIEKLTEAEKVQLRFNYIMDKTSMMQGDAVRTADSLANQMKALEADVKNAAVTLGNALMPAASGVLAVIRSLTSSLRDMSEGQASALTAVGAMTVAILALGAAFMKAATSAAAFGAAAMVAAPYMAIAGLAVTGGAALYFGASNAMADSGGSAFDQRMAIERQRKVLRMQQEFNRVNAVANSINAANAGPDRMVFGESEGMNITHTKATQAQIDEARMRRFYRNNPDMMLGKGSTDALNVGGAFGGAAQFFDWAKPWLDGWKRQGEDDADRMQALLQFQNALVAQNVAASKTRDMELLQTLHDLRAGGAWQDKRMVGAAGGIASTFASGDVLGAAMKGMQFLYQESRNSLRHDFGVDLKNSDMAMGFGMDMLPAVVNQVIGVLKQLGEGLVTAFRPFTEVAGKAGAMFSSAMPGFLGAFGSGAAQGAKEAAMGVPGQLAALPVIGDLGHILIALQSLTSATSSVITYFMELSTQTESYGRFQKAMAAATQEITKALEPFWNNLMPVAGIFIQLSKVVGLLVGSLMPGAGAANVFARVVLEAAQGMSSIILAVFQINLAFQQARVAILEFMESLAPGDQFAGPLAVAYGARGEAEQDVQDANKVRGDLSRMSLSEFGQLANAVGDTTKGFRALNATLTNIPSGFKGMAGMALAAMDATGDPLAGTTAVLGAAPGTWSRGGPRWVGEGGGNHGPSNSGPSSGHGAAVVVNGNVTIVANNPDDFKAKMERKAFVQSGTPLPGVKAFLAGS